MDVDNIYIEYRFDSALGKIGTDRYVNACKVHIYSEDHLHEPTKRELIGKAELSLVLLNLMMSQQIPYYTVFDNTQFLSELGETVFDYEENNFRAPLLHETGADSSNLLVIDRVELLPNWRKKNIGRKIIKDIIWRFSGCFGLVMLKAFPLQQEYQYADAQKSDWEKHMQMTDFPQDEELANYKVFAYYQSLGFSQFENTDYFYLNAALVNKKFDAIDMNDEW